MKKVISNDELKKVMLDSINMICDAVASTLGPSGNNVLVSKYDSSPFITNDGVTIAEAIESDDEVTNAILEIVKEASLKTNELVGDGTTTTLVLLQSIYNLGLREIIQGKNALELKKELNNKLNEILNMLDEIKMSVTSKDLINIASTSANDKELGSFLADVYSKTGSTYGITVEESNGDTYYEVNNGYNFDINELSNIYFQDNKEIKLNNVYILLLNGYLNDLEQISFIINEGINRDKNILILTSDVDEQIKEQSILYFVQEHKNIFICSIAEYGERKEYILKDIEYISKAKIKNINFEEILWNDLGYLNKVIIKKENITLINNLNNKDRTNKIKEELLNCKNEYDKEFLEKRIANLSYRQATIYVGGITKTEVKEKKMRITDALCSLNAASKGILPGEGISLLKISEQLNNDDVASKILKEALKVPFTKILENAGISPLEVYDKIKKANYEKIYNILNDTYENINKTDIIDPYLVVAETIKNAISIAGILLTSNYLVINEKDNNNINYE